VSGFVQVQRGRRDNTILHRQKRLLSFQIELFCISGLKNGAFSTRQLCEWRRRENM